MKSAEHQYTFTTVSGLGARRKAAQQQALFKWFLPPLPPGAVVVEIGAGRGEFARECTQRKLDFTGIEPSGVWAAKLRAAGYRILTETVPPLPLETASVDLLHSSDVVEHFADYREVMRFLAEVRRVLKPGGHVSIIAPNHETIRSLYFKYEYQHSFIVTRHRLRNMLQDSDLIVAAEKSFLHTLAPGWNRLDRVAVHVALPVLTSAPVQSLVRAISSDAVLFKINKNLFDHVALLGRKPLDGTGC